MGWPTVIGATCCGVLAKSGEAKKNPPQKNLKKKI